MLAPVHAAIIGGSVTALDGRRVPRLPRTMDIERTGTSTRWSDTVVHGGTLYVVEVPAGPGGDVTAQTREVLASLEATLEQAGSSKARLLMVTIFLDDIRDIDAFNAVWDAWVPPGTAPVRACVGARLGKAGLKVEVQAIAAVGR
jgi:enamine deaminase RidA (YjgF/YER057c/UK114 family)